MGKIDSTDGDQQGGLIVRPVEDIISLVQDNDERVRVDAGIPTKVEIEDSNPRVSAFMLDPFLDRDEFLEKTEQAQAILLVAFATGAMPDRLVRVIQQRIQQGIPIFVLSNNPGDSHGILKITYDAGSGAYESGAVALEKVNVNHHPEVKEVLLEALGRGLEGKALAKEIGELYAYQEGEKKPLAEGDDPNYVEPPELSVKEHSKKIAEMLKEGEFMDQAGNYLSPR